MGIAEGRNFKSVYLSRAGLTCVPAKTSKKINEIVRITIMTTFPFRTSSTPNKVIPVATRKKIISQTVAGMGRGTSLKRIDAPPSR